MLTAEMLKMLEADASQFPPAGAPDSVKKRKPLKAMEPEALAEAAALIAAEQAAMPTPDQTA